MNVLLTLLLLCQDDPKARLKAEIEKIIQANHERTMKEIEALLDRELGIPRGRPFLGIQPGPGAENGVEVAQVVPNSPAAGKLEEGDIIRKINGLEVSDVQALAEEIVKAGIGTEVTLTVSRGDKSSEIKVTLGKMPEQPQVPPAQEPPRKATLGIVVEEASNGLAITEVREGSPAAKAGAKKGDILTAINGEAIKAEESLKNFMSAAKPGDKAELTLIREGRGTKLQVVLEERK
jgi:serine protease Do